MVQVTIDTEALAGAIGALAGAAGAAFALAVKMARPVRRHMDRFRLFLEDWEGEPARYDGAVPARPGMMVRMSALEREFKPNGGSSLRDRVNEIERRQNEYESAHRAACAAAAAMAAQLNGGEGVATV